MAIFLVDMRSIFFNSCQQVHHPLILKLRMHEQGGNPRAVESEILGDIVIARRAPLQMCIVDDVPASPAAI
jgi:hypothetical protein